MKQCKDNFVCLILGCKFEVTSGIAEGLALKNVSRGQKPKVI